jgi:hypothetical protein
MLTNAAIEWRVMNQELISNMEYVSMTIKPVKKLLKISGENTKIAKTIAKADGAVRIASLSMMPDAVLCPGSKAAGCRAGCLESAGRGAMSNVAAGRQARTDYWHADRAGFLDQLRRELRAFVKTCKRQGVQPVARLNVLSDIDWERHGIPQEFPEILFYDYTKRAARLGKTPNNYRLLFSYSGRDQYAKQVEVADKVNAPGAVVFNGPMPEFFRGRKVIDGDASDLVNAYAGRVVVGLKAKGKAKADRSGFVVHTGGDLIALGA